MNRRFRIFLTVLFLGLCHSSVLLRAEETKPAFQPNGKISGNMFGDYFYNLQNADSTKRDFNGFQFRRIYLGYNYEWSERFAAQFLLEADGAELTSSGKIGVFVKNAYLEWKDLVPMASLYFGMIPTPTWSTHSEKIWGYRSIEKTILDLRKAGVASDLGLGLKGKFNQEETISYYLIVGNGQGQKPENDKYKKFYGYIIVKPVKDLSLEGDADYEGAASDKNKFTFKGFVSYQTDDFTLGIEGFQQTKKKALNDSIDVIPFGITVFAHATLVKDQLRSFARYDFYNPDTKVDNAGFNEHYFIAGLDYLPQKNIHLMPNILINSYSDKSPANFKKKSDITARLTFYYVY
ncbi:MAG: hypothetical protein A2W07_07690 [candidate division Zixibacteria bacterium RBG_16_43_9]|nr:MAG: hypothetical protein A2W07_07690 [candidate division Zixibacteria bacterium RBG_16_43_9]